MGLERLKIEAQKEIPQFEELTMAEKKVATRTKDILAINKAGLEGLLGDEELIVGFQEQLEGMRREVLETNETVSDRAADTYYWKDQRAA